MTWSRLQSGTPGGRSVLAVDFEPGRHDAGFPEMVEHLPADLTMLVTEPPQRPAHDRHDVDRILADWLGEAPTGSTTVAAVLGFCAGATIAGWLASEIGRNGPAPVLMLFDPSPVTPELFRAEFAKASSAMLRAAGETGPATSPDAGEATPDLFGLADRLSAAYAGIVRRVAPALDVDDDLADDLVGRFAGYLRYLAVAGATAWPSAADERRTVTVTSAAFDDGGPPLPGRRLRMQVDRAELLGDRRVATTVADVIGG